MTPELETSAEVRKTGHRWVDLTVAACALIVSVTSLSVAIKHGRTMERMAEANARLVAANSWPMLARYMSTRDAQGQKRLQWWVVNEGVGPAKVETLEVSWKGRPIHTARELLETCCLSEQDAAAKALLGTSDLQGSVLRPGESRGLIDLPPNPSAEAIAERFEHAQRELTVRACYCDVFDECWASNLMTLHPVRVQQCPTPKVPFAAE